MYEYGDFQVRRQHTLWHALNRLLIVLIAFSVITLIACAFLPALKGTRGQSERVEELHGEIKKQKALVDEHTHEVYLLKNDPTYIETVARDRLDMMKKDETIYRIGATPAPDLSNMRRTTP